MRNERKLFMERIRGHKKNSTVFSLLVRPIVCSLFCGIMVYTILLHANVLSYLRSNAIEVFEGNSNSRALAVSGEMSNCWTRIDDNVKRIVKDLEIIVESQGAELVDIQTDAALNQLILDGLMDDVIQTLRNSGATEAYLVLNGSAVEAEEKEGVKAGVYLRTSNPNFFSHDNQDLLLERGVPAISKKWQLSLDSYWSAGFDFTDEGNPNNFFFTKPFKAATLGGSTDFRNYAYWSHGFPIHEMDHAILSYSVPLIASDGSVIGVMGVGVSEEHFKTFMSNTILGTGRQGAIFLGKTLDGEHFEPLFFNSATYNRDLFLGHEVTIRAKQENSLPYLYLEGQVSSEECASVQYLQLYDNNTPFQKERWAVVCIQPEKQLLSVYNSARMTLAWLALGGILLGTIGVAVTSRRVTKSLRRLMEDLRGSDSNKPIRLRRVLVEEIDELINAIESLSNRVAESSSKISTILQMAESGIGVYEYMKQEGTVFCSRSVYELCEWKPVLDTNEYIDSLLFLQRMEELEAKRTVEEDNLYEISLSDNGTRWLRINRIEDDKSIIGVVTDVTAAVLEKRNIAYERDYDMLTNLYNLRAFQEKMRGIFQRNAEDIKIGALVMWDLDNLKFLNDAYGHHMGDAYIIAMAECLRKYDGEHALSARRSGDEFYTFLFGFDNQEEVEVQLKSILHMVQKTEIALPDGRCYKLRASAGVSWYPENSMDFNQLYKYSDFAMYAVKHSCKGEMQYFDPDAYHEDWYLAQGQGDFTILLDNRLVRYATQAIMAVADGSIYGYEMLMRSEMDSFQSPMDILRMARAQSRLYDIEVLTWLEALRTFARLTEYGLLENGCKVFINSIANQMLREDMQKVIEKKYAAYLPHVVCEFTEEEQGSTRITKEKLELMHRWQAKVALDDYGCGYNSEAVLLAINPDIIKIDMEMVRDIDKDANKQHLVKNVIHYAHDRNILVLGEGVETAAELKTLIDFGVDLVQGYYISKPSFDGASPSEMVCREAMEYYRNRN